MDNPRIAILGSGHSGHALAATFCSAGFKTQMVSLSRHRAGMVDVSKHHGILLKQQDKTSFVPVHCTADLETAVKTADIIFCTVPALYHKQLIDRLLPTIRSGQTICFSSYFGAMKILKRLESMPQLHNITVVETMSAIHAARVKHFGEVEILAMKDNVPIATYPQSQCHSFINRVKKALPCIQSSENILTTSLNNIGPILHVPLMLLNAARIEENNNNWNLYRDGLTESVQTYIKKLDTERLLIGEYLSAPTISLERTMLDVFYQYQHNKQHSVYEWLRQNEVHASTAIGAPNTLNTRYLTEGVYHGLKPLAYIARQCNLVTPMIDATIQIADALLPEDAKPQLNFDFIDSHCLDRVAPIYRQAA